MDPSCLVSTVQAGGGGVMVWVIFSWHTLYQLSIDLTVTWPYMPLCVLIHGRPPHFTSEFLFGAYYAQMSFVSYRFKALARSDGGNTMRVPLKTNCPITLNSLASGAYSLHSSKPPVCMACLTLLSSLSAADASSTVLIVSALRVAFTFMLVCLLPLFPTDKTRKRVCYVSLATVVVLTPISRCECMVLTAGHRQFPVVFDPWLIKLLSVYVWMESLACSY